jgi:hypothetical protein
MNTYTDASYRQYLSGKPYMMPVSPWFYTNAPGYDKNWLWRGDDLWYVSMRSSGDERKANPSTGSIVGSKSSMCSLNLSKSSLGTIGML